MSNQNYDTLTIRDLTKLVEKTTGQVEDTSFALKAKTNRLTQLKNLLKKTQEEIDVLASEGAVAAEKLKTDKHQLRTMKKKLAKRTKASGKEDYVKRCRTFLLDNAALAADRVHYTDFGADLDVDTGAFFLPNGTLEEQNTHLDTLSDDNIIAFAHLLHLCKGFDEAECENVYDDQDCDDYFEPPTVEKLDEIDIVHDFGVTIFISNTYDCNGRQEYSCCPKRHAYTLNVYIPGTRHLVTYNEHFSLDTKIEESWGSLI